MSGVATRALLASVVALAVATVLGWAVAAEAKLVRLELAQALQVSPLTERPVVHYTAVGTSPQALLDSAGQALTAGYVRATIHNRGSVEVCVSWSGDPIETCGDGATGYDCDGDNGDGVLVLPGERYSPVYSVADLGELCGASASGTPDVVVTYDTP